MDAKRTHHPSVAQAIELAGSQARLAAICGVTQAAISKRLRSGKPFDPIHCSRIKSAFPGQITYADLRPDDWHLIWGEGAPTEAAA